jgi:hypothetical protein
MRHTGEYCKCTFNSIFQFSFFFSMCHNLYTELGRDFLVCTWCSQEEHPIYLSDYNCI